MRISLNWLQDLVAFDLPPAALAEQLTMVGFEVEDIEDRGTWADGVVIGQVLTCDPHPNANKLRVCTVDIGAEAPSNIVCGAPNVAAGLYVPVATLGTYLPNIDLKIKKAKLRGVPSHGMICSLKELGLETDLDGIHVFDTADVSEDIGGDARPYLGLDDIILDLTSTANRADALSMVGVAREVAALTGAPLTLPEIPALKAPKSKTGLNITVDDATTCPAYIGTAIEGVTIAPSPDWLQQRLIAAGTRPINNVVDITNYILLMWGQPLHAFDQDALLKVAGGKKLALGVRFAQAAETLTTLDSQERALTEETLVITANDQPVALAGVMGGESTEVAETTTNLVLEAALFNSLTVRRSARPHSLRTEASSRYERGVNETQLDIACRHALQLITELAGGNITVQASADQRKMEQRTLTLRLNRVRAVLGSVKGPQGEPADLEAADVTSILERLEFEVTPTEDQQVWSVGVPPHRDRDIEREIDLIEEIARLYGYDNFCETLPAKTEPGYLPASEKFSQRLRRVMRAAGLTELMHYSWVKTGESEQISVVNPLLVEFSALRTEMLTSVINAYAYNLEQGNGPLNGFEPGRVFWQDDEGLQEAYAIGGIMGGDPALGKWNRAGNREQPLTWYAAKGRLEQILRQLGLTVTYRADPADSRLHPGRTASLWLGEDWCGRFGQLHPQVCQERELPESTYLFELHQDILFSHAAEAKGEEAQFSAYSSFPATDRDLAFFVATDIPMADIEQAIWQAANKGKAGLLDSVELFDEYRGEHVPEGHRSLAFRLLYRSLERTLTEEDVTPVHNRVRRTLTEKFKANLRS